MDSQIAAIVTLLLGLVAGAALGWFFASRPVAEWKARFEARDGEAKELDEKFRRAITELATESERAKRADALADELALVRGNRDSLSAELATLKANASNFDDQTRLLLQDREELRKQFELAGAKVLEGAQEAFLKRAQSRFEESEKTSAERLNTLLAPVDQKLKSYVDRVAAMEAKNADGFGLLTGQIEAMRVGQEQVRAEAARLGNSLRNAPKARGRWGEQQLRNVLEQCGLGEHTDFELEHSINTEEGRLRPDAIIRVPGNKLLVIDAKVSLNAYQDAFDAQDDTGRDLALAAHSQSMRNHIQTLAAKSYQSQFKEAPDYVLMFVPGEHFIAAALEHDSSLWDFAFERRVLLASPTNLVAIAKTVASVWQQVGIEKEAREIGKLASDLYDSLAKTQEDFFKTGMYLGRAVNSFNDFAKTYEGNVLSRARRLTEKHIKIGKREISEEVPLVESAPRYGRADETPLLGEAANDGIEAAE